MFDKLRARLRTPPPPTADTVGDGFPRRQLAVVARAIELAQSDRSLDAGEVAAVEQIVAARFGLDAATASRLAAAARRELDASLEDWIFATAVREGFDAKERVEIVELLWEVVYADGRLAHLEDALMLRLAVELGLSEAECDAARAIAFAHRNQAGGAARATETE